MNAPAFRNITWAAFDEEVGSLVARQVLRGVAPLRVGVYGVPCGGAFVALAISRTTHLKPLGAGDGRVPLLDRPEPGCLVVDDLVDSGATLRRYAADGITCDALYRKPHSPVDLAPGATLAEGWLRFPWEHAMAPEDAVVRLLQYIGEDVRREGLRDTPRRVLASLREMTGGGGDPALTLATHFSADGYDQVVAVRGIEFVSLCEHHMLPFTGTAAVAYLPKDRVVGLSKLARLVDAFAHRLQLQERLTRDIAAAIQEHLAPRGVAVVLRASHACLSCRGVRKPGAEMATSAMFGVFRTDPTARAEVLALL